MTDPDKLLEVSDSLPSCFVLMPITDSAEYVTGHFARVYNYLIRPACRAAGFRAVRADEAGRTNYIAIDILQQIIHSEMVVCDLSARNPNVLYELGIRQAFNKPVTLIKDRKTERIFDIQGLRTFEYDGELRVDQVEESVRTLAEAIKSTAHAPTSDVNSLIELLGVKPAQVPQSIELTERESLILNAIKELGDRIDKIDRRRTPLSTPSKSSTEREPFTAQEYIEQGLDDQLIGQTLYLGGKEVGTVEGVDREKQVLLVRTPEGKVQTAKMSAARFPELSIIPF